MKEKKKLTYEQQQKKLKKKRIGKTIAVSVGWSLLLAFFVALICLQVKSCKDKQTKAPETTIIGDYTLNSREYNSNNYIAFNYQGMPFNQTAYNEIDNFLRGSDETTYTQNFLLEYGHTNTSLYYSTEITYVSNADNDISIVYKVGTRNQTDTWFNFTLHEDGTYTLNNPTLSKLTFVYSTTQYLFTSFEDAYEYYDYDENYLWWGVLLGYNSTIMDGLGIERITFVNDINRFAPLGGSNSTAILIGDDYVGTPRTIFNGIFTDLDGTIYKAIKIQYVQGQASGYIDTNGNYAVMELGSSQYMGLFYTRYDGTDILVNTQDYVYSGDKLAVNNHSTWVSSTYQSITIYCYRNSGSSLPTSNLNRIELLKRFNSESSSGGGSGGSGGNSGGTIYDAFTLLKLFFSSIASFTAIQLVPGITIGTMVALPLMVGLVFVIIWLFKR